jgi:hypothetical protein
MSKNIEKTLRKYLKSLLKNNAHSDICNNEDRFLGHSFHLSNLTKILNFLEAVFGPTLLLL